MYFLKSVKMEPFQFIYQYISSKIQSGNKKTLTLPMSYFIVAFIIYIALIIGNFYGFALIIQGIDTANQYGKFSWVNIINGAIVVVSTWLTFGLINGFLHIIKAQTDSRNAILKLTEFTLSQSKDNTPS
jgi:hypothetical protein